MSEEVSATDSGAEQSAQPVDPVNAFEAILDKSFQPSGETSDVEKQPPETEPELEAEPTDENEPTEELFTVKIDGKEVQVTRDQLIANYQKGEAANQRFEQAANERKAAQAEYQQVAQQRLQAINSLHVAQQVIQSQIENQPNWAELIQNDPVAYLQQRHEYEQKIGQLQQLQAQQAQLQQIQAQDDQASRMAALQEQSRMLQEALPEWSDSKKATQEKSAIKDYLAKQGYDNDTIESIADARAVLVARKAMLYDQMMQKAQETAKKVQTLPKVQRPGVATPTDNRTRDMQSLRKTGSTAAAASIFEKLL